MKVLHLVRAMDVGGLESVVIGLVDGSRAHGVTPFLGCLYACGALGSGVGADGTWVGGLQDRGFLGTLRALCRYVREHDVDLIHSHNPQPHLFAVLAGLFCRTPVVHTKHGRNYPEDAKRVWLNRQLSRFTKRVVAVSEDAEQVVLEIEHVPSRKVMVIRNGIDVERFSHGTTGRLCGSEQEKAEEAEGRITIGSVGRLSEDKDYPMLVRAFARMREQLSTLHRPPSTVHTQLLFVGDGPDRKLIENEAQEQGVAEHCEFAGMQSNVEDWLAKMDLFCLSSVTEGTSMTLLEAGATGLPSVVTDVGGNSEIVANGESGFVVPAGDEEAFAEALVKLVENDRTRKHFGDAARKRIVERYSIESMVEQYIRVYEEMLNRSKRRKRR
jgi:glycosyltransferase involved in cell wall biosynthesis